MLLLNLFKKATDLISTIIGFIIFLIGFAVFVCGYGLMALAVKTTRVMK